jgi:hypothetical protein
MERYRRSPMGKRRGSAGDATTPASSKTEKYAGEGLSDEV